MKHLGDITKIKGCNAPVVDCIIGGSPCQDLSVAGKRAGLAGERSGLYMEQIRIIKEMRHTTMEENLYRVYTLRDMGYYPYVMIYDKPNAPQEVKHLARWCNNKFIFKSTERFEDYDPKRG